ncbi:MAG: hypothetical protein HWQ38_08045 [Nostoc sp. NMS7]|uniref:hypothetical protein n=1 Tax=Nostoc sp. NMS7 TaxID=2815391 RepID=UPI0025E33387|nr:hypothetical protein [Nostoc sp. NMS7]MBN3946433.1 hypothetical protein [Nostoc sp. NMS7]
MIEKEENSGNEIYYRIKFNGQEIAICELQWFDESGYNPKFWLAEETFATREDVIAFLKSKVLPDNLLLAIKSFLSVNDPFKL